MNLTSIGCDLLCPTSRANPSRSLYLQGYFPVVPPRKGCRGIGSDHLYSVLIADIPEIVEGFAVDILASCEVALLNAVSSLHGLRGSLIM